MSRTLEQKTNHAGFPKPGELIEITGGVHKLEATDRAMLNVLYRHAHDSGRMAEDRARWEIPMAALRVSEHRGKARIADSLDRLMSVVVTVPRPDARTGEPRFVKTHLFNFFDLSADESATTATVRFGLPEDLQPILARSSHWGRIKAEVVCAMTSKYAMALYELIQLRANLDRCVETFPVGRFRDLLGVPPKTYDRGNDFLRFVVDPACIEVNGLSDMDVKVELKRRHDFAPVEGVTVAWWRKEGDQLRETIRERTRPKAGRSARLRSTVETVRPAPLALPADVPKKKSAEMGHPEPASRAAGMLIELDAAGAEDIDYRAAFSTGSKVPLRRGETWRGRLVARVAAEPRPD